MAVYNEIQHGRFNRYLQMLTGIKGRAPVKQLAGEITPAIIIPSGNEDRFPQGWNLFGNTINIGAGGAGNAIAGRIRNPSGSNVVAVITKILLTNTSAALENFILSFQASIATDLTTVLTAAPALDARVVGQVTASTSVLSTQTFAGVGTDLSFQIAFPSVGTGTAMADLLLVEAHELPLLPGSGYQIRETTLNSAFVLSIWWRERFLEEGERR